MKNTNTFRSSVRPGTLQLLREFQSNTLEIAPLRRTRHEEMVVVWSPLPEPPRLPLRYMRRSGV